MKVLFVYSVDNAKQYGRPLRSWSDMQHGISYISSVLKADGHQCSLAVLGSNLPDKSLRVLEKAIEEFDPQLICFTSVCSQYLFMDRAAALTKARWPHRYLVAGGVHPTLQPEPPIAGAFDAVCIGEGEYPTLELCRQLEAGELPHGIANLWIKRGDVIEKNPPRPFIGDLDQLPLPDYEMWRPWIDAPAHDAMTVFAGRGCPYECTYCCNHALRKVAPGKYVRTRSPQEIVKEVRFLYENFQHREIYFEIETLDCNIEWAIELCGELASFNASVPDPVCFGSNYRINPHTISERLFAAMKRANFTSINIGLEAGSERIRREILKRNYSNEDVSQVVALAGKHGLEVYLYNMIGLPGESLADHLETVRMNRQCQPAGHYTGIFYPYPGTELHRRCGELGLFDALPHARRERRRPVLDLPGFSKSQVSHAYTWFDYRVYQGHRPLWKLLLRAALVKIDATPAARYLYQKLILPIQFLRCLARRKQG